MASLTLGASAVGGLIFGVLADKLGRTRALVAQHPAVFGLHVRVRPGAERLAVRDLPRAARHRHGRRMGERRHARQRDVAGAASRQGARHHAELLGDRLWPGGDRRRDRVAAFRMARGVLRRHPAGALHALDSTQRAKNQKCGSRTKVPRVPQVPTVPRSSFPLRLAIFLTAMNAATMFAWWGLNLWVPSYLSSADDARRRRAVDGNDGGVRRRDAGRDVARLRIVRIHRRRVRPADRPTSRIC